jgi:hypothetical protein
MPIRLPRPIPIGPIPLPTVPPPIDGLGSNSNYILYSDCNAIRDLSVTIHLTQDLVWQSSSGDAKGFSFQLNAYSPIKQLSAWQQYVITLKDENLQGAIDNWPVTGPALINERVNLTSLPNLGIPAEYELEISLNNDDKGTINGVTFVVTDVGITPAAGSSVTGYVDPDEGQHVNFIGTDGHIHELFIRPGEKWIHNDLMQLSGNSTPPISGSPLAGYARSDGDQHVFFVGIDGHVHELHIEPNGSWENNDLTHLSVNNIGPAPRSALAAYWGPDGGQHVDFIGTDGHVRELYLAPGAQWVNNDLIKLSHSRFLPASGTPLTGYWGDNNGQHVNYIATDGHVHELYIHPGAQWIDNDLIQLSGNGTPPAPGSPLTAYPGPDRSQHVNFIGTDGHVHELYIHPDAQWINNDLIRLSGNGVAPAPGTSLHGYWGPDYGQHVNFIGLDGHVRELYNHPGEQWVNNDLTLLSQTSVTPASTTHLTGYWGPNDGQQVNYIGSDGHLHELSIHPDAHWIDNDLNHFELARQTQSLTGLSANKLSPITAFELNIVGPENSEETVFSSGAGTITYTATTPLTVLTYEPSCTESDYITAETANTSYGPMFPGPSQALVQYFYLTTAARTIRKKGRHPGHVRTAFAK